jgi:hypothetical protein
VSELAEDLISDAMRGMVGKVLQTRTSYPVSASDIRKWAIAVYYPKAAPARFMAVGAAAGEAPLVVPEEFNPFGWATREGRAEGGFTGPGYIERMGGVEPPELGFIVNGGSVCDYGARMLEGDVITAQHSVTGYSVKQGKAGRLLLTQMQDRWTNQRRELVRNTVSTLIRY